MPSTTSPCPASSRHSSTFARDAVFAAFRPRQARALDYGDFIDRDPAQLPRRHPDAVSQRQAVLERLVTALRQVGDDAAGPSAA